MKDLVVAYLESGTVLAASAGPAIDYFTGARLPFTLNLLTDGEWIWFSDLAHYVRHRDSPLVPDFVAKASFSPPAPVGPGRLQEIEREIVGGPGPASYDVGTTDSEASGCGPNRERHVPTVMPRPGAGTARTRVGT